MNGDVLRLRLRPYEAVPRQAVTHPASIRYLQMAVRLLHVLIASLPSLGVLFALHVGNPELIRRYLTLAVLFGAVCVLVFQSFDMYGEDLFGGPLRLGRILFAWSSAFGMMLIAHTLMRYIAYIPPLLFGLWFVFGLVALVAQQFVLQQVCRALMRRGVYLQRAVILGCTDNGIRLARHLREHGDVRFGVIGFIDDPEHRYSEEAEALLPRLGDIADLERLIREQRIDLVLMAMPWPAEFHNEFYGRVFSRLAVHVLLAPDVDACSYAQNCVTPVAGLPMLNVSRPPLTGWSPLFKRCEDLVLATLALVLLAPLMALIAIAVKLDSPGPVLFRQKRYGYNHRLIVVYKFRSMYHHLRDANASRQTGRADARVTRIGRFIRRTSLDELPQLFNVLSGSMSLVGPRPHATATKAAGVLFEDAVEAYTARHRVKPGITGLAQIRGQRGETDTVEKIEKRVESDLYYIEHWSLWLDLYVLARTFPAVLMAQHAY